MKKFNLKKFSLISSVTLSASAVIAIGIAAIATEDQSTPLKIEEVLFSTKTGNENLVELFTDGYDFDYQKEVIESSPEIKNDLKDFYMFDKFITNGAPTMNGRPSEFGGFQDFNKFEIRKRFPTSSLGEAVFERGVFLDALKRHLDIHKTDFNSTNVFGVYDTHSEDDSLTDAQYLERGLPGVNVESWTGSRDKNTSDFGITSYSPDSGMFKSLENSAKITSGKGARVLAQDMTTHAPHITGPQGQLDLNATRKDTARAVANNVSSLVNKLKALKDQNGDAYDNSFIIVWGDHSDHDKLSSDFENQLNRSHSNLMIKFPHESKSSLTYVSDKLVSGPQINRIIKNELENHDGFSFFSKNQSSFEVSRKLYESIDGSDIYYPTIWDSSLNKIIIDPSRSNLLFDENRLKDQLNAFFSEQLGGIYE